MSKAKTGDTVKVHYTGTLEDGTVFDTSREREPFEFKLGEGTVIPGFDEAVTGLEVGESTKISIEPEDAYGEVRNDLMLPVPKEQVPDNMEPEVGMQVQLQTQSGQQVIARIVHVDDEKIMLDANHPLAGKTLSFDIELLEISA